MRVQVAVVAALCALITLGGGTGTAGAAGSQGIVISQVYGGGGNTGAPYQNDYVELFNRGTTSASLGGWSIQYASATGTGTFASNGAIALSGSVAPGRHLLVRLGPTGSIGSPLPAPDIAGPSSPNLSGTAGKVIVANTATGVGCNGGSAPCSPAQLAQIVDLVGYGGANFSEGSGPAATLSNATAAIRRGGGCVDTDDNAADFAAAAPSPRNSASPANVCDVPTGAGSADPDTVAAGGVTRLTVAVTPAANPPSTGIGVAADLSAIGGSSTQPLFDDGTHGDPTAGDRLFTYEATPAPATTVGTNTLPATITDAEGRTGTASIALVVTDSCGDPDTPIHDVQGAGATSPLAGSDATIQGVVSGSYQGAGGFGGFYVQEPDADADSDPATSEGIFVFSSLRSVSPGDVVRVLGRVTEFATGSSSLTELSNVSFVLACGSGAGATPADLNLPVTSMSDFERYEGMLVRSAQSLTVSDTFTLGRFGEVRLAAGGRLYTPTAVTTPGAAALAREDLNRRSSFVLDDGDNQQNIDPTRYPLGGLAAANTLRSGDTVEHLVGLFDERFSSYRVQPVGVVPFLATNPRTPVPDDVGGNLKVAAFNVLNFFNGNGSHQAGAAGGFPTARGANTLFEFDRQLAKEVSALKAIDADVVGLMELENDAPPNSAIEDLVDALNDAMGAGTYAFIDTGAIGTDQIKVALIYKPAKVRPVGPHKTLTSAVDPRFIDTKNRPSLAQTFELTSNLEPLTVVVNHLKSKGSDCDDVGDPDAGDGQGNCNRTRTKAAQALVDWLATNPTGADSADYLVIGDMNSYTFEDPITAITDAGYRNLIRAFAGLDAYSYVFRGESGYLDHALASPSLAHKATRATEWHINADEPIVLDYNTEFKTAGQVSSFYDPRPYRASDHDPVVVGLSLHPSFARVCELTRSYVTKHGVADSLCAKLAAARAAAQRGDDHAKAGALRAYANELEAQSGKAITEDRATFLARLAAEL